MFSEKWLRFFFTESKCKWRWFKEIHTFTKPSHVRNFSKVTYFFCYMHQLTIVLCCTHKHITTCWNSLGRSIPKYWNSPAFIQDISLTFMSLCYEFWLYVHLSYKNKPKCHVGIVLPHFAQASTLFQAPELVLGRGISILGEVRNAEISRVTQQLLCSKF